MGGHGEKLSRKQEQAVAALLQHGSIAEAASAAGVNEKTLRLWLRIPVFAAEFRAARSQVVEQAVGALQQLTGKAVRTLADAMDESHAPSRVRAAVEVLKLAVAGVQLIDLVERVEALERRAGRAGPRGIVS